MEIDFGVCGFFTVGGVAVLGLTCVLPELTWNVS